MSQELSFFWNSQRDTKLLKLREENGLDWEQLGNVFHLEPSEVHDRYDRIKSRSSARRKLRHCHDCGRLTSDYRCPACWKKLRETGGYEKPSRVGSPEAGAAFRVRTSEIRERGYRE